MLKILDKLPKIFGHIYTILLVLISWVIFAFEDLGQIGTYLSTMFGLNGASFENPEAIYYLSNYIVIIIIGIICSIPILHHKKKKENSDEKIIKQDIEIGKIKVEEIEKDKQKAVNNNKKQIGISILTSVFYLAVIILSTSSLVNNSFNPFLYFRF